MFPFAITSLGGTPGIAGAYFTSVASGGVLSLAALGLKVNDLMVVVSGLSGSLSSGGTFTAVGSGALVYTRQLTATDIAGTYTAGAYNAGLEFYTGPNSVNYIATYSGIVNPVVNQSSPGFVKNVKHLAPFAVIRADGATPGNTSISSPAGFVRRSSGRDGTNLVEPHDMLIQPYVDNTPIVWSANGSTCAIYIYEFRS